MSSGHITSASDASVVNTILIGALVAEVVYLVGVSIYNLYFHPLAKYPGPAMRAAFHFPDALSKLSGTSYKDTKLLHDRYGSVVRLAPDALSYTTAQAWKDIYALKPDRTELGKDNAFYQGEGQVPSNILIANQSDHARYRKLMANAFSDSALLEQERLLTQYFELLVSKLKEAVDGPAKGRVDIMAYYNWTTFDIIGDLALGKPFGALGGGEYHWWISNVFASLKQLSILRVGGTYPSIGLFFKVLLTVMPSFSAKREAYIKYINDRAEERMNRETDRKDITSHASSLPELLDGPLTYMILATAGSETTATLLTGATFFLLRNPDALRKLQAEVRAAFQTEKDITLRSVSTPGRLPYLEAVLQESLRCYPPVPATLPRRTGPGGALIDGKYVPGNISVGVHQWSTYRTSANFADPDTFDPERWLTNPPVPYSKDNKEALQPFSMGPRVCIGRSLAWFEMRSILSRVVWNFDLHLEDESRNWLDGQTEYTLWNKPSLWVRLKHRVED